MTQEDPKGAKIHDIPFRFILISPHASSLNQNQRDYQCQAPINGENNASVVPRSSSQINRSNTSETHSYQAQDKNIQKGNLSLFHNFQKHLITFLKKSIRIDHENCNEGLYSQIAIFMWKAFKDSKLKSKKHLHFIVGMTKGVKFVVQLWNLGQRSSQFEYIRNQWSLDEVAQGLEIIRQQIIRQSLEMDRQYMQARCSVSKSEQFFEYFVNFIQELRSGQLNKRMSKHQKEKVMKNIKKKGLELI